LFNRGDALFETQARQVLAVEFLDLLEALGYAQNSFDHESIFAPDLQSGKVGVGACGWPELPDALSSIFLLSTYANLPSRG
jgi:hypothetical protein